MDVTQNQEPWPPPFFIFQSTRRMWSTREILWNFFGPKKIRWNLLKWCNAPRVRSALVCGKWSTHIVHLSYRNSVKPHFNWITITYTQGSCILTKLAFSHWSAFLKIGHGKRLHMLYFLVYNLCDLAVFYAEDTILIYCRRTSSATLNYWSIYYVYNWLGLHMY